MSSSTTAVVARKEEDSSSSTDVGVQIHDLRLDLQRVHPEGILGNLLFWWLWPVKFVADPGTYVQQQPILIHSLFLLMIVS